MTNNQTIKMLYLAKDKLQQSCIILRELQSNSLEPVELEIDVIEKRIETLEKSIPLNGMIREVFPNADYSVNSQGTLIVKVG